MWRVRVTSAKLVLVALAVGVGLSQTVLAWERGLPPTEVFAPFLYIPVLAGAVIGGWGAGLVLAALASLLYGAALQDQSHTVGFGVFVGLLIDRAATYALYAALAAFAARYVERRLTKLEWVDRLDDATGLGNAANFVEESELEISRADRYGSAFSLASVHLDADVVHAQSRKRRAQLLRILGSTLTNATRKVDRAARIHDDDGEEFVIILPETGPDGSEVLASRLDTAVRGALESYAHGLDGQLRVTTLTFPRDRADIEALRERARAADAEDRVLGAIGAPA
jgi:GGDEF domain-containing protein